ncbi:MAG: hypothetical protein JRH01_22000 [Deltaproteobacteria bacterium]|nr:hypothetical protein [Deltaproteobacteria bacterium]MBW2397389.1 hypothetical protein [Deltaproteobacteria bacterium]
MKTLKTLTTLTLTALILLAGAASAQTQQECSGPKRRIAVMKFGSTSKLALYEGYDVGEALSAQLTTALQQTGCFIVTERLELASILREQEMGMAGILNPETAAKGGRVIGAEWIIKGEVTELEVEARGKGFSIGLPIPGLPAGIRLGGEKAGAHLGLDLRIVDSTTGATVQSHYVSAESKTKGMAIGFDSAWGSIGGDTFSKTPLGKAARNAIVDAVNFVLGMRKSTPWTGRVVQNRHGQIFLNAGQNVGLEAGQTFVVVASLEELVDPETGLSLGAIEQTVGEIRIERVEEKFAVARATSEYAPQRGDLIRAGSL